ncbi:ferrous iron transport protein B [Porphyromonas pogonae]|uniref:ferrous iron transport protein B n=1 Tax=Porphyromonas pogonae TaxID=867595 RepID=UPI002E79B13F|nr:ferrous iron transport protein B [Porphyromonas pogonae]
MKLSELKTGEKAVIEKVGGKGLFRKRILEMGFVQGKEVSVIQSAPLKDPIYYRILDYNVSLRREDAALIEVRKIEDTAKDSHTHLPSPSSYATEESSPVLSDLEFLSSHHSSRTKGTIRVALIGNPNCGKTSLFNQASGAHEHVGNYSGVTVEAKSGYINHAGYRIELIDLPGTYSLSPYSPEELYIRDYLSAETRPDIVLNVVDTCNLERNLYLTMQVKEMGLPMVMALNMFDEFSKRKERFDYPALAQLLGIPMIPTVCRNGLGLQALFNEVIDVYEGLKVGSEEYLHPVKGKIRPIQINYGSLIEPVIEDLSRKISEQLQVSLKLPSRYVAVKLMEQDKEIEKYLMNHFTKGAYLISYRDYLLKVLNEKLRHEDDVETIMTDQRYGFISGALRETYTPARVHLESVTDKIDHIVTHHIWGFPFFLAIMLLMFECTFVLGAYPMDWLENLVGLLGGLLGNAMSDGPLKDLLIQGVIGGVGGVLVFLPNILILYLFISLMEDSGYMSRAAFIMDKVMHKMGLHGKSFIPLVMGFGCNVPAIMSTRTIESRKSRMITMLILPFMSCSARLPVYLLLAGAFFPNSAGLVLFSLYMFGILLAVISAKGLKSTYFKGEDVPFVMELPPYRIPTTRSVLIHMWTRAKQYLQKMGSVILLASIVIWFLGYFPNNTAKEQEVQNKIALVAADKNILPDQKLAIQDSLVHLQHTVQQENSYIGRIGQFTEPIIRPLGFDWKMGISLLSGLAAKEVVVSTLGVIYTGDADDSSEATEHLSERIKNDKQPDGSLSFSPLIAYNFMIFVLIYFPCIATIIAIGKESGSWKWSVFSAVYSCSLAWLICFIVYQIGNLPIFS